MFHKWNIIDPPPFNIFFWEVNLYKISSHFNQISYHKDCFLSLPHSQPSSLLTRKDMEAAITFSFCHESLGSLKCFWGPWASKMSTYIDSFVPVSVPSSFPMFPFAIVTSTNSCLDNTHFSLLFIWFPLYHLVTTMLI